MSTDQSPIATAVDLPRKLKRKLWDVSAPESLRNVSDWNDNGTAWKAWRARLLAADRPHSLAELLGATSDPLNWGMPVTKRTNGHISNRVIDLFALQPPEAQQSYDFEPGQREALAALQTAHQLPRQAARLSSAQWWSTLAGLLEQIEQGRKHPSLLTRFLLSVELPITLAYLFPELRPAREAAGKACRRLIELAADAVDARGVPRAEIAPRFHPFLATWTRSLAMLDAIDGISPPEAIRKRRAALVRYALGFTRPNGGQIFSTVDTPVHELLKAAVRRDGTADDHRILGVLADRPSKNVVRAADRLPATLHDEDEAIVLGRPRWSSDAWMGVSYAGTRVLFELGASREVVLAGEWTLNVKFDGKILSPCDAWQEVCWVSDEDVDYLELELDLNHGVRVQRHFTFAKKDRCLLLADALLGSSRGLIEYESSIPFGPRVQCEPCDETREVRLRGRRSTSMVMPLALPEWKSDTRVGSFNQDAGRLHLRQHATAENLFAPLWIDFDNRRARGEVTWRTLTVADTREIMPAEVAAAYRAQAGREHWLVYRSLAEVGNRTFFGHNLSTEFFVGRFDDGKVETIVEIE